MENLILTNIKTPNDIVLKSLRYNSKTPQQYFDDFSKFLNPYGIKILGFVIDTEWKGNSTIICFSYNNFIYKTFTISKLWRYYKGILENGFVPPRGIITPEILNDRCNKICIDRNLQYNGYNDFKAARTKLNLMCLTCELEWDTTIYDSFINHPRGCPSCATYGFSQNKDGFFYIMKIHSSNNIIAYKMGITNNLELRISQLKRACKYEIDLFYVIKKSGTEIFNIESKLKKNISCNYLSSDIITDGYTETFSIDLIETVLQQL